jgi:hypothetical protein
MSLDIDLNQIYNNESPTDFVQIVNFFLFLKL